MRRPAGDTLTACATPYAYVRSKYQHGFDWHDFKVPIILFLPTMCVANLDRFQQMTKHMT
jgi:hypothetical protein